MMSRKSIFDLERRVDLRNAYNTVIGDLKTTIVNPNAYIGKTLLSCLDAGIKTWPYRNAANTIEMYARSHGFSFYGRNDSDMIYSFELLVNLLHWVSECNTNNYSNRRIAFRSNNGVVAECKRCCENIEYLIEQLNMKIREKDIDNNFPQYVFIKRDVNVDAVVEVLPELAETLLSYLDIRNQNDIEVKKLILKQIADYLEPNKKAKVYSGTCYNTLCDDLFFVFNNCSIRHNNDKQIKLTQNEQMDLYDRTFKAAVHLLQKGCVEEFNEIVNSLKCKDD